MLRNRKFGDSEAIALKKQGFKIDNTNEECSEIGNSATRKRSLPSRRISYFGAFFISVVDFETLLLQSDRFRVAEFPISEHSSLVLSVLKLCFFKAIASESPNFL